MDLGGLAAMVSKFIKWGLGLIATVFGAVIGLQSLLAGAADSVALKAGKFLIGSSVPVIGGAVSDAIGTVYAGLKVVKGTAGAAGICAIVVLFAPSAAALPCLLSFTQPCRGRGRHGDRQRQGGQGVRGLLRVPGAVHLDPDLLCGDDHPVDRADDLTGKLREEAKRMELIRKWVLVLCVSAVLASVLQSVLPEKGSFSVIKLVLSLYILITLISPVREFSAADLSLPLEQAADRLCAGGPDGKHPGPGGTETGGHGQTGAGDSRGRPRRRLSRPRPE